MPYYTLPVHPYIQIRFLGDPSGTFTKDLDLTFDSAAVFGQDRSKRYALVVEDGKVKSAHVEPDNTGVNGRRHTAWNISLKLGC